MIGGTDNGGELLYGGDGNDTLYAGTALSGLADTLYGGDGSDTFVIRSATPAALAITGATITGADIFSFVDGTDKITLVGFGFTTSGSPSLITSQGGSFGAAAVIVISTSTANNLVEVYLNGSGNANNYAKVTVNGVTTLDLTDFDFG